MRPARSHDHGDGDEAALAEHHIRPDALHDFPRLSHAAQYTKGIHKVLQREVAPELPAGNAVIAYAGNSLDHGPLHAVLAADVMDFPALVHQLADERNVGDNVPRGSTACKNDLHSL